jgi:hypothetical protein
LPPLAGAADVLDTAAAQFGMFGVAADVFAVVPAAHAFGVGAGMHLDYKVGSHTGIKANVDGCAFDIVQTHV